MHAKQRKGYNKEDFDVKDVIMRCIFCKYFPCPWYRSQYQILVTLPFSSCNSCSNRTSTYWKWKWVIFQIYLLYWSRTALAFFNFQCIDVMNNEWVNPYLIIFYTFTRNMKIRRHFEVKVPYIVFIEYIGGLQISHFL